MIRILDDVFQFWKNYCPYSKRPLISLRQVCKIFKDQNMFRNEIELEAFLMYLINREILFPVYYGTRENLGFQRGLIIGPMKEQYFFHPLQVFKIQRQIKFYNLERKRSGVTEYLNKVQDQLRIENQLKSLRHLERLGVKQEINQENKMENKSLLESQIKDLNQQISEIEINWPKNQQKFRQNRENEIHRLNVWIKLESIPIVEQFQFINFAETNLHE